MVKLYLCKYVIRLKRYATKKVLLNSRFWITLAQYINKYNYFRQLDESGVVRIKNCTPQTKTNLPLTSPPTIPPTITSTITPTITRTTTPTFSFTSATNVQETLAAVKMIPTAATEKVNNNPCPILLERIVVCLNIYRHFV